MRDKEDRKEERMKTKWRLKKHAALGAALGLFVLCGCKTEAEELKPYEWSVGGTVMSYYDSVEEIDEELCQKYDSYFDGARSDSTTWVAANADGEIRVFVTEDSSVETCRGISVGDALSAVEDAFSYEYTFADDWYMVYFDGDTEVDTRERMSEDDWVLITYWAEEGIITEISIYDPAFGGSME